MKKLIFIPVLTFFAAVVFFMASCSKTDDIVVTPPPPPPPPPPTPTVKPNQEFYGITTGNALVKYNANASQTAISTVAVTGLQAGENLLAIDFRPATGQLYGLGNSNRLYVINLETGAARAIGTAPFTPGLVDAIAGFDFNPTVDRIRVVTTGGQNLRLHPELGTVVAVDGTINNTERITGVAYTNSFAGASSTTLFDIDPLFLFKQDPPNNGTITKIGTGFGLALPATGSSDFDISPDNKVALVPMTVGGINSLYQLDTAKGTLLNLGQLATPIIGLAIPTNPVGYSVDNANNLMIFDLTTPAFSVSKAITGLQPGETVLGIDMRPATGQLYALGSTSRLYTINMSSGAAAAVSVAPFTTLLSGTSFGFDFNPVVDRIRVVSNTGQNLRLDPNTGLIAAVDGSLNPGTPNVASAAYTNNFAGTTTTTLFVIDATTDKLYTQNPPNNGTLVEVGSLGINITADNGFDIGGRSGKAYGVFSIGSFTKLYTLDLATGLVIGQADVAGVSRGFAIGLGF
jgi:hypothetical protein